MFYFYFTLSIKNRGGTNFNLNFDLTRLKYVIEFKMLLNLFNAIDTNADNVCNFEFYFGS